MIRVAVVVMSMLFVASACGGSGEPKGSDSRFTKDSITQVMTAAMVEQGSMHIEMTLEGGPDVMKMSGDQQIGETAADAAMAFDYEMGEVSYSITLVDGIIFANLGESSNGKFVRIDPKNPQSAMGSAFAPMIDELDITKSISQFEDAITGVEQIGDAETIDGVETTPFLVTIDTDKAVASGALDKDSGIRPGTELTYTFFIDDDDLLRRMAFSIDSANVRMDMTNFGEPVDIKAPPADEIVEESDLGAAA